MIMGVHSDVSFKEIAGAHAWRLEQEEGAFANRRWDGSSPELSRQLTAPSDLEARGVNFLNVVKGSQIADAIRVAGGFNVEDENFNMANFGDPPLSSLERRICTQS